MTQRISAYIPIKNHSLRIPKKNFKLFNGKPLFYWVITTLHQVPQITEIAINTDSYRFIHEVKAYKFNKLIIIHRPDNLKGDDISMNQIIKNDLNRIPQNHILQTHVTNPLLTVTTLKEAIKIYFQGIAEHNFDSVFSVTTWRKRFFYNKRPINHKLDNLIPTQDLEPVYEENSNFYLFSKTSFIHNKFNRIGTAPKMFPMNPSESIDIDYPHEFVLAEALFKGRSK